MPTGLIRLQKVSSDKLKLAKWMRSNMTLAEKCFWNGVKTDKFMGLHFRRQQIIHGFIADFYCEALNLVVEVDGGIHEQQKDCDQLRTKIINRYGIKVIRFSNEEVLNKSDWVMRKIKECAET
jgi:very-short-patch-repair endonuclease